MKRLFTKKFRTVFLILLGLFVFLFLFRLGYGYTLDVDKESKDQVYFDSFSSDKKNYASNDYKKDKGYSGKEGLSQSEVQFDAVKGVDQKYEKIAEVNAETHNFKEDETYVRNQVKVFNGIIQYERKYGNKGERKLQLQIGVPPENFDTLYNKLIAVGITHSKEIIKHDKTNHYLELNARKASLEKTLSSLIKFKEKGGRIDEYVNLENRILEIEKELQQLGVNLGDFDESNEFCTVKFALSEGKPAKKITVSFYHRCKIALEWAIRMYLTLISGVFFALLVAYLLLLFSEKIGLFKSIGKKIHETDKKNKED
ncbi:MAG: DUF4349 domain-containing protein [Crocinitomicaceae bacterium]